MTNYPDRKKAKKGCVGWLALSFVCGYMLAWFYSPELLTTWFQTHVSQGSSVEASGVDVAELPKPKFEFYTLLTQDKTKPRDVTLPLVTTPPKAAVAPAVVEAENQTKPYILQLASFQRREDAEHMLAGLVMRGFEANINTTTQQGAAWHRVVMGPFASRLQAEKVQGTIAKSEHISGIVRRITM